MRMMEWIILLMLATEPAFAVSPNECKQQQAQYPKVWNDVSKEKGLFDCYSKYAGGLRIKIGNPDDFGRTLMSLVPLRNEAETSMGVYRIWLDREQVDRLKEGKYFATIVRKNLSCWVRGDLNKDSVFFMDNADPPADTEDAGSFYNKAPRFSVFQGNSYTCNAVR